MEIAALVLHYLTLLVLIVGYLQSMNPGHATPLMVWGARAQLLIGLAMVGVASSQSWELNHVWVAVKLLIAFVVVGLLEVAQSKEKKNEVAAPLVTGAAVLAVVNVAVAVFWH